MTWQAPPNDSTGFWDQYGRELPGLISVPLHISAGIHSEGELTHFLQISPTSVHNSGCLRFQFHAGWRMALSGWHVWVELRFVCLLDWDSSIKWWAQGIEAASIYGCLCQDPYLQASIVSISIMNCLLIYCQNVKSIDWGNIKERLVLKHHLVNPGVVVTESLSSVVEGLRSMSTLSYKPHMTWSTGCYYS